MTTPKPKTIRKFPFKLGDEILIDMPQGAQVIHVQDQGGTPCVWAIVDPAPDRPRRIYKFFVVGTGYPLPKERGIHLGTWSDGPFVWHLFSR